MKKILTLGLLALFMFPLVSSAAFDTNLKYQSKGQSVMDLQDFLVDQGLLIAKPNGYFGLGTLKAVKAFQTARNITPVSGFWGPTTRANANAVLSADINASDADERTQTGTVNQATVDTTPDTQALLKKIDELTKKVDNQVMESQTANTTLNKIATNTATAPVVSEPVAPTCNMTSDMPGENGKVTLSWTTQNLSEDTLGILYAQSGHSGGHVTWKPIERDLPQQGNVTLGGITPSETFTGAFQGSYNYVYKLSFIYYTPTRQKMEAKCFAVFDDSTKPSVPDLPEGSKMKLDY